MRLILSIILIANSFGAEQDNAIALVSDHWKCNIEFKIQNAGFNVDGSFENAEAQITFNEKNPLKNNIMGTADASSIHTGIDIRDKHLKRADYLDVANFPFIYLRSRSFTKIGRNKFNGTFDLTIKETTKSIIIPFQIIQEKDRMRFEGTFAINRLDFNIGSESAILSEMVEINVSVLSKNLN